MSRPIVNGLWIGGALSPLEILTIKSFQSHGYDFQLWAYNTLENVPASTTIKDANTIIPQNEVFSYNKANKFGHGKGSFAGFSDIFRYKLLYEQGGIWVDMDVTCLRPLDIEGDYIFRFHHKTGVVGNYMKCPPYSELMKWCYEEAVNSMDADSEDWMLPIRILNQGIEKFNLQDHICNFSNLDSFPIVSQFIKGSKVIPKEWAIIHWMNEEFRRVKIKKDQVAKASLLQKLMDQYEIDIEVLSGTKKLGYLLRLSRLNYIYLSLSARIKYLIGQ